MEFITDSTTTKGHPSGGLTQQLIMGKLSFSTHEHTHTKKTAGHYLSTCPTYSLSEDDFSLKWLVGQAIKGQIMNGHAAKWTGHDDLKKENGAVQSNPRAA